MIPEAPIALRPISGQRTTGKAQQISHRWILLSRWIRPVNWALVAVVGDGVHYPMHRPILAGLLAPLPHSDPDAPPHVPDVLLRAVEALCRLPNRVGDQRVRRFTLPPSAQRSPVCPRPGLTRRRRGYRPPKGYGCQATTRFTHRISHSTFPETVQDHPTP